ncbi:MAG: AsmA family protein [Candidatus Saganbacteria bacterium]|nr:AsmA family protein [Candidatus Saganbacteria bacterium]
MKKNLKWLAIIVAAIVALLIIGAVALPFFLPLEKIKDFTTSKISDALGCEVAIEKVSFNLFSGIKLEDISVGNAPGFSKTPFVRAKSLDLRYAFWPIFRRQLIVKEIRLVSPQIYIEKNAQGQFNFTSYKAKDKYPDKIYPDEEDAAKEDSSSDKKAPFSLIIDAFSVRDGTITYFDQATNTKSKLKNTNLTISGITLALLKPVNLHFKTLAIYQDKQVPISLAGKIEVDPTKNELKIPSLELNIAGEKAKIELTISNWKTGPDINFSISSKKLSIDPLLAIFAAGAPSDKKAAKPGAITKAVNKTTSSLPSTLALKGKIDLENITFQKFKIDKLDLDIRLFKKWLELEINEVGLYDGKLSGTALIKLVPGLSYQIKDLTLTGFNATPFVNALVETFLVDKPVYKDLIDKVYGRLDLSLNLSGSGVEPGPAFANAVAKGSFTLTGGEIKRIKTLAEIGTLINSNTLQENVKFKDLGASFSLRNKVLEIKDLKLEDTDFSAQFSGGADLGNGQWMAGNRLLVRLSPSLTQGLPSQLSVFRDDSGWLNLTFELTGAFKNTRLTPILATPIEKTVGKLKIKIEAQKLEIEKKVKEELEKKAKELLNF